jgi:sterol desaturase/sphingolipid hydroxylase (fatty acid hydroxylase superfamily)
MDPSLSVTAAIVLSIAYFGTIALIALGEALAPRRALAAPLRKRWFGNLALAVLDTIAIHGTIPVSAIALSYELAGRDWGLLNAVDVPLWLAAPVAILALDLARYAFHWTVHSVPALWRVHAIHHTDLDYDFTTALRFHPVEALLSAAWTLAIVAVLGPPVGVVIAVEALFIIMSVTAHANMRLPAGVDRILRRCLVTPDLHRVHHSTSPDEANANFGTIFPFWDRLFATYVEAPALGHVRMEIGLAEHRGVECLNLTAMLLQPFRAARRIAALDRHSG